MPNTQAVFGLGLSRQMTSIWQCRNLTVFVSANLKLHMRGRHSRNMLSTSHHEAMLNNGVQISIIFSYTWYQEPATWKQVNSGKVPIKTGVHISVSRLTLMCYIFDMLLRHLGNFKSESITTDAEDTKKYLHFLVNIYFCCTGESNFGELYPWATSSGLLSFYFEMESHCVTQAGLELAIFLPQAHGVVSMCH